MGSDTLASSHTLPRVDRDLVSRFATCCRALGLVVHDRQRPADLTAARSGFAALTHVAHDQCDAWTGLAASGDVSPSVVESVWRTSGTAGVLKRQIGMEPKALGFVYDTGLYLQFRATDPDDFQLAYAAALSEAEAYADADQLVTDLLERRPGWPQATWLRVAICYRTERWSDVVRLLTVVVNEPSPDELYAHAARVTLGIALARLGLFAPALSYLEDPDGPAAVAAVDGALAKALSLSAQGEDDDANEVLQDLYAANPENPNIEEALSDSTFGLVTTTAARIDARTNPWDPDTEPSESEFIDPGAKERKTHLLIEAEAELAQLIGLDEVKYQVARLKSSVAMAIRRQDRGLTVAQRTNHLVFAGPPGTGKTTIARVVAKIYCGLGLLKKETVREVHRADLIGQHIGETEAKTNTRASSVSIATKPKSFLAPVDTRAMRCGRCRHRRSGRRSRLQARQLTHVSLQRAPFELTASQWRSRVRRH